MNTIPLPRKMHQLRPFPAIEEHHVSEDQDYEVDADVTPAGTFVDIHVV